jgi:hypothetical protein
MRKNHDLSGIQTRDLWVRIPDKSSKSSTETINREISRKRSIDNDKHIDSSDNIDSGDNIDDNGCM